MRKKATKKADPLSMERLDAELEGLLRSIPSEREKDTESLYCDDRENKIFAVNLARIMSHHQLSIETMASKLGTSIATLTGWLHCKTHRHRRVVKNIGLHLGVGPYDLCRGILSFTVVEKIKPGAGLKPDRWNEANWTPERQREYNEAREVRSEMASQRHDLLPKVLPYRNKQEYLNVVESGVLAMWKKADRRRINDYLKAKGMPATCIVASQKLIEWYWTKVDKATPLETEYMFDSHFGLRPWQADYAPDNDDDPEVPEPDYRKIEARNALAALMGDEEDDDPPALSEAIDKLRELHGTDAWPVATLFMKWGDEAAMVEAARQIERSNEE